MVLMPDCLLIAAATLARCASAAAPSLIGTSPRPINMVRNDWGVFSKSSLDKTTGRPAANESDRRCGQADWLPHTNTAGSGSENGAGRVALLDDWPRVRRICVKKSAAPA